MENIQTFDVIVVSLVTLLGLKGLFRGFIKEIFALVGIVGGVFVASRLSAQAGEIVNSIIPIDNNNTMVLVGFIAALISFWILAYAVGTIISKVFSLSGLGIFDKALGFIFGAGKVFLLFSIITYAASQIEALNKKIDKNLSSSMLLPMLKTTGAFIIKLDTIKLENGVSKSVNGAIESTKKTLSDISKEAIKDKANEMKKDIIEKTEEIKKEIKE